MPTTLLGITLYVAALFPGVAFAFSTDGHRSVGKRSVLRETVTFVFVSVICDVIVILLIILASIWVPPIDDVVRQLVAGDYSWLKANPALTVLFAVVVIAATTSLGYWLGSKQFYEAFLQKTFDRHIPRDKSAWSTVFEHEKNEVVDVALVLKSGAWVGGVLDAFDNDPDPHPNRTITITGPTFRAAGETDLTPLDETHYLVISASDIELLQVSLRQAPTDDLEKIEAKEESTEPS